MDYEARQIKVTRAKGLTLVELMVTIAIAAILTAIAAPNFTPLIKNNRFAAQKNELQSALNLARSEAVKRNGTVSVCISNNGSGCSGHSNHFHHGWLVFADANADGEVNGGDVILRAYNEAFGRMKILFSRGEYVTYGSDGLVVVEQPQRQRALLEIFPDALDGVQFWRIRRQRH